MALALLLRGSRARGAPRGHVLWGITIVATGFLVGPIGASLFT